jgi:hypothetical protein
MGLGHSLSLALSPRSGTGAVEYPLSISLLGDWLDYRTAVGVGGGNPIDVWAGRKGLLALTASGTARPTCVANDGDGKAAAYFDGTDDSMNGTVNTALLYGVTGDFEQWFMVKGLSAGASSRNLWQSNSSLGPATQTNSIFAQTTPRIFWYSPSASEFNWSNAVDIQDDAWHLVRARKTGSTRSIFVDGVSIGMAGNAGAGTWINGMDTVNLGSSGGGGQYWLGGYRHALFFRGLLDDDTAAALTSYLLAA